MSSLPARRCPFWGTLISCLCRCRRRLYRSGFIVGLKVVLGLHAKPGEGPRLGPARLQGYLRSDRRRCSARTAPLLPCCPGLLWIFGPGGSGRSEGQGRTTTSSDSRPSTFRLHHKHLKAPRIILAPRRNAAYLPSPKPCASRALYGISDARLELTVCEVLSLSSLSDSLTRQEV